VRAFSHWAGHESDPWATRRHARLSDAQRQEIYAQWRAGRPAKDIARDYGVDVTVVCLIGSRFDAGGDFDLANFSSEVVARATDRVLKLGWSFEKAAREAKVSSKSVSIWVEKRKTDEGLVGAVRERRERLDFTWPEKSAYLRLRLPDNGVAVSAKDAFELTGVKGTTGNDWRKRLLALPNVRLPDGRVNPRAIRDFERDVIARLAEGEDPKSIAAALAADKTAATLIAPFVSGVARAYGDGLAPVSVPLSLPAERSRSQAHGVVAGGSTDEREPRTQAPENDPDRVSLAWSGLTVEQASTVAGLFAAGGTVVPVGEQSLPWLLMFGETSPAQVREVTGHDGLGELLGVMLSWSDAGYPPSQVAEFTKVSPALAAWVMGSSGELVAAGLPVSPAPGFVEEDIRFEYAPYLASRPELDEVLVPYSVATGSEGAAFVRSVGKLAPHERLALRLAANFLGESYETAREERRSPRVGGTKWTKKLRGFKGLSELRIDGSLRQVARETGFGQLDGRAETNADRKLLLRAFYTVDRGRVVFLSAYDKLADNSDTEQNRQAGAADRILKAYAKDPAAHTVAEVDPDALYGTWGGEAVPGLDTRGGLAGQSVPPGALADVALKPGRYLALVQSVEFDGGVGFVELTSSDLASPTFVTVLGRSATVPAVGQPALVVGRPHESGHGTDWLVMPALPKAERDAGYLMVLASEFAEGRTRLFIDDVLVRNLAAHARADTVDFTLWRQVLGTGLPLLDTAFASPQVAGDYLASMYLRMDLPAFVEAAEFARQIGLRVSQQGGRSELRIDPDFLARLTRKGGRRFEAVLDGLPGWDQPGWEGMGLSRLLPALLVRFEGFDIEVTTDRSGVDVSVPWSLSVLREASLLWAIAEHGVASTAGDRVQIAGDEGGPNDLPGPLGGLGGHAAPENPQAGGEHGGLSGRAVPDGYPPKSLDATRRSFVVGSYRAQVFIGGRRDWLFVDHVSTSEALGEVLGTWLAGRAGLSVPRAYLHQVEDTWGGRRLVRIGAMRRSPVEDVRWREDGLSAWRRERSGSGDMWRFDPSRLEPKDVTEFLRHLVVSWLLDSIEVAPPYFGRAADGDVVRFVFGDVYQDAFASDLTSLLGPGSSAYHGVVAAMVDGALDVPDVSTGVLGAMVEAIEAIDGGEFGDRLRVYAVSRAANSVSTGERPLLGTVIRDVGGIAAEVESFVALALERKSRLRGDLARLFEAVGVERSRRASGGAPAAVVEVSPVAEPEVSGDSVGVDAVATLLAISNDPSAVLAGVHPSDWVFAGPLESVYFVGVTFDGKADDDPENWRWLRPEEI
ncbi:MAG: hypothetical protein ACRCYU_12890, partial [Nocardioides sp.]